MRKMLEGDVMEIYGGSDALIVVDLQQDFCPGGSLVVRKGDEIVAPINRILDLFSTRVFTQDWHPRAHVSFESAGRGGRWPVHCVAGTPGADFHPDLRHDKGTHIIRKGIAVDRDAYSGFDGTGLAGLLRELGISRVFICGLATDFCVKATALDALHNGFKTVVLEDVTLGVNLSPGDVEGALREMKEAGALLLTSGAMKGGKACDIF